MSFLRELILKNRSYRRFYQEIQIPWDDLVSFVELARLSPSAKNLQHFKFHIIHTPEDCEKIFPLTGWAGYLKDWPGPEPGERPVAYITILHDTTISPNAWSDQGIPAQSILLGAVEKGYGGCIIASLKKNEYRSIFDIPAHLEIIFTIALGKPKEIIVLDDLSENNDIKYWRDENQVHHVPKRPLNEIILNWK